MSTSEPIYTYVRGQGWVVAPPYKILTFDKGDGWVLKCENRAPLENELFFVERNFERTAKNLSEVHWNVERLLEQKKYLYGARFVGDPVKEGCCVVTLVKT